MLLQFSFFLAYENDNRIHQAGAAECCEAGAVSAADLQNVGDERVGLRRAERFRESVSRRRSRSESAEKGAVDDRRERRVRRKHDSGNHGGSGDRTHRRRKNFRSAAGTRDPHPHQRRKFRSDRLIFFTKCDFF